MSLKKWKVVSTTLDKSYRIFDLKTNRAVSPRTGKEHEFYVLESMPWVNILPITPLNEVVLIRQYRHGTGDITLEIPGGIVEKNDTPESAAIRELYEETGYRPSKVTFLGSVSPNPAILNNLCYSYLAQDVFLSGSLQQDDREDIEVLLQPLKDVPELIRSGAINHALVLNAFFFLFMQHYPEYFRR